MALVKSLTELHGGKVACMSAGVGKGSTPSLFICPGCWKRPDAAERRQSNRNVKVGSQPLKILVVDDNQDAAKMLCMYLEALRHQVMVEHDPLEALKTAKNEKPSVCILDIGLPEIDGNALARRLRAQPETAHAALIAVTGYGQLQDKQNSSAAGFNHHLVKPVDSAKLLAIISDIQQV